MALITKLNNIATAIGEKTGQPASTYTIDNMPAAIRSIVTDFPVVPEPDPRLVRFIDYDGTIVTQMSLDEAHELTSLPTIPTHEDLQAVGWTSNLETIQTVTDSLDVGAMYISTVTSPTGVVPTVLKIWPSVTGVTVNFVQSQANGVTVDWGDNTTPQTASGTNVTLNHTYAAANVFYTITLTPDSGVTLTLGGGTLATLAVTQSSNATYGLIIDAILGECAVGANAFSSLRGLRSLVMSNLVSGIGQNAFQYNQFSSVVIPSSLSEIGASAFSYCDSLKQVVIPNSITSIPNSCFAYCASLETIVIPNSVTSIRSSVFSQCINLSSIVIPDSVTLIESGAFSQASSLQSIVLPSSITAVPGSFVYFVTSLKRIVLPSGVTNIGQNAFQNCRLLESITLPDAITTFGQYAFSGCYNLKSMVLPASLASIGRNCFEVCYQLESITFPSSLNSTNANIFASCYNLKTIIFKDRATIPANLNANGYIFQNTNHIIKLDFTDFTQVPTLANATNFFAGMPTDTKIVVPDSLYTDWIAASGWNTKSSQIIKESLYTE